MGSEEAALAEVRKSIAAGDFSRAEDLALHMPPSWEKSKALLETAERSDRIGLLDEAAEALAADALDWQRAELWNTIAKLWLRVGRRERATQLWNRAIFTAQRGEQDPNVQNQVDSSKVLGEIAVDLAQAGESSRALDVAESIAIPYIRTRTVRAIS